MKSIIMIILVLFSFTIFGEIEIQPEILETLKPICRGKTEGEIKEISLKDGIKAKTIVFHETRWELKHCPQSMNLSMRWRDKAMKLTEKERLKTMNRIDNYIQIWVVPKKLLKTANYLKKQIPNKELPNEYYKELAFLGVDNDNMWFAEAPIYDWIRVQEKLKLREGENKYDAALRGTLIDDKGTMTKGSCLAILGKTGPKALPYIEKAIKAKHPELFYITRALIDQGSGKVTEWLINQADSENEDVKKGVRASLVCRPVPEAVDIYKKWLKEDGGKKEVIHVLDACKKMNVKGLSDLLQPILKKPSGPSEYRWALELLRKEQEKDISKLLDSEKQIYNQGKKKVLNEESRMYLDKACMDLIASKDTDMAAIIGVRLALQTWKGPNPININESGIRILQQLPDQKGIELVNKLEKSCIDFQKNNLAKLKKILSDFKK